ncbi:small multi-drug export protein [archaeon]|nr:small multi-drug export protein [archaeon]
MNSLIIGLLLTVLPITELRIGLPIVLDYAIKNSLSIWPFFVLVLLLNILVVFFVFFFLDFIHIELLKWKFYSKTFEKFLVRLQKKGHKLEIKMKDIGFFALFLFVAIPLPGTGAWTGCLLSWLLDLDRKKSILAISLGVIIAGILILLASLGLFSLFAPWSF